MISHKHKAIFIHIPKTAGMSIEDSFLRSLGLGFFRGKCPSLLLSYNDNKNMGPPSLAHLLPEEYVRLSYISEELYNSYFKFAFIRNPWARAVSIYKYFRYHRMLTFEAFMEYRFPQLWKERYDFVMPQVKFLYDENGKLLVDFIGKFENLEQDFEVIKSKVSHPLVDLPHINKPPRSHNWYSRWNMRYIYEELKQRPGLIKHLYLFSPANANYREYYTPTARKLVEKYYRLDIEKFDYQY